MFRKAFPTVRAATVLTPDAAGVPELLDVVRHPEKDELVEARAELKRHLLGPDEPTSQVRFNEAVQALCAAAQEHRTRMEERLAAELPAEIPDQRRSVTPQQPARPA